VGTLRLLLLAVICLFRVPTRTAIRNPRLIYSATLPPSNKQKTTHTRTPSQRFRELASRVALNASHVSSTGQTLVQDVLSGWHRAVEKDPLGGAKVPFARLLRYLVRGTGRPAVGAIAAVGTLWLVP
jgi:hypothetical protein